MELFDENVRVRGCCRSGWGCSDGRDFFEYLGCETVEFIVSYVECVERRG